MGERYDREAKERLALRVTAHDGGTGRSAIEVVVELVDASEAPIAPAAPVVTAPAGTWTELEVAWEAPDKHGPPGDCGLRRALAPGFGRELHERPAGRDGDRRAPDGPR